jgi:IS30 family transposase
MGQCYGQLSLEERVEIYRLQSGGRSQNQIALALKRAPSTISRELRRNSRPTKVWSGGYEPVRAQQLAERRHGWDGRFKLARQPDLRNHVGKSLAMGHSPEQIAGRLALEHGRVIISHESNLSFHLSSNGSEGLLASVAAPPQKDTKATRTQPGKTSSNNGARLPTGPPRSKIAEHLATGKPTSCCSPNAIRGCCFFTKDKAASTSFTVRPIGKPAPQPKPSPGRQTSSGDAKIHPL